MRLQLYIFKEYYFSSETMHNFISIFSVEQTIERILLHIRIHLFRFCLHRRLPTNKHYPGRIVKFN